MGSNFYQEFKFTFFLSQERAEDGLDVMTGVIHRESEHKDPSPVTITQSVHDSEDRRKFITYVIKQVADSLV